jgi:hypothetical protein
MTIETPHRTSIGNLYRYNIRGLFLIVSKSSGFVRGDM